MRVLAASLALLAGCDFEATHHCGDTVCPQHLACVDPPIYQACALPANIDQCHGMPDYATCNYFNNSGAGFEGACRGGVCVRCTNDLEGCNAGAWTPMTALTEDLNAIYVAARGDAYAAGNAGTLFHYDGLAWSPYYKFDSPIVAIAPGLVVLDSSGRTFLLAPGAAAPMQITAPAGMTAVGGREGAVYGVGLGFIAQLGNGWMVDVMDGTKIFNAVAGAASGQVFAAGNTGLVDVFDGNAWNVAPAQTARPLKAIWAGDGEHAYAVGTVAANQSFATIVQLDPSGWSASQTSVPSVNLLAVWGSAADDVYAGGEQGKLYHYTTGWSPISPLTAETIKAIGGSGAGDVFAVGTGGVILHYSN